MSNAADTHTLLWLLLAFALGTLWQPTVELMWSGFIVDNGLEEL